MKRRKKLLTFVLSFVMALGTFGGQATLIASAATSTSTDFWKFAVSPTELPSTGGEVTLTVDLMDSDVDGTIYYCLDQMDENGKLTENVIDNGTAHITTADNTLKVSVPENKTENEVKYQITLKDSRITKNVMGSYMNLGAKNKATITVAAAASSGDTTNKVLCDEHTYRAKVVDEKGNPVEGVNVNIYSSTDSDLDYDVKTDKDGVATYAMTKEDGAQSFDVTVADDNWTSDDEHAFETLGTYEAYGKIATIETVDGKALAEADEVVFTVQKKGGDTSDKVLCDEDNFRAKVVDENGNPVEGVTVELDGKEDSSTISSYEAVSDANGLVTKTINEYVDYGLTFDVTVKDSAWNSDTTHQFVTGGSSATPAKITTVDGKALAEADEVVFVVKAGGTVAPKVLSDATHFRAKVVDVDDKPVSGAAFEVKVQGVGTHEITSNEKGVIEYELDNSKDFDTTITVSLKANDKWASNDEYKITTNASGEIYQIDGKTLSDEELSYILHEKVDKSVLKTALDNVEALGLVEDDYTKDSWYTYAQALDKANSVYKNDFVNKEDVDDAASKLEAAVSKLVKADLNKAEADKATDAVSKLTKSDYTADSWKAVEDAQAELEAAIKDGLQSKVDAATAKVNDAVSKLVKAEKPSEPTKPSEPAKPAAEKKIASVALSKTAYTYNGKAKKPSVTVKDTAGKKIPANEYTVKYAAGRKKVGKYTVTVTLKNGAKNTVKASFRILPKKTSIKSLKKGKKAFTVKWLRKGPQLTGYQVQYSTSKAFAKNVKTKTVKGYKANTKKVKKLSKNKTYYVRVRTYKKVGKTTYYAAWSKAKKVTTK